jgi:hypothetical protein
MKVERQQPVPRKSRRLTKGELRAIGATPGLMARRYDADSCARLEQLVPESPARRSKFIRRLVADTPANEEAT